MLIINNQIKTRQRGVALLTVLMVVVLAVGISTYLIWIVNNRIEIHEMQHRRLQSRVIAQTGIEWAGAILYEDYRASRGVDTLNEIWAQKLPTLPVRIQEEDPDSAVQISGEINDENSKININNLAFTTSRDFAYHVESLRKLLATLDIPMVYANYIIDWVDNNDEMRDPNSAESDYYLKEEPPYRSANQALAEFANLSKIRDMNTEILTKLKPYITFLPKKTKINVNTASAEVLAASVSELNYSEALVIVENRQSKPFMKISEFVNLFPEKTRSRIPVKYLSTGSKFFIVKTQAIQSYNLMRVSALLERNSRNWPYVWWHRFN